VELSLVLKREKHTARTLIDRFADEGYEWAISDKIDALDPSFDQYSQLHIN